MMYVVPHAPERTEAKTIPLLSVAISKIDTDLQNTNPSAFEGAVNTLQRYITGSITYKIACRALEELIGTSAPADFVENVLNIVANRIVQEHSDPSSPITDASSSSKRCRMWSKEEDLLLLAGIHKYGLGDWKSISKYVGCGRSRSQCSQRWGRAMNPQIAKDRWSAAEEQRLKELVSIHGEHSWAIVAKKLGTRSDVQCRYRFYQMPKASSANLTVSEPRRRSPSPPSPSPAPYIAEAQAHFRFSVGLIANPFACSVEDLMPPLIRRDN